MVWISTYLYPTDTPTNESLDALTPATIAADNTRLLSAFLQLARGIQGLHAAGMLHRDLKPNNVIVVHGRVIVLDFGLVRDLSAGAATMTADGTIAGTPAYMAPEQIKGTELGAASDWYAFGVMLYEALAGELPIYGTLIEILRLKLDSDPAPVRELAPDAPPWLAELCMALLRRDPNARPTGAAVIAAFEQACHSRDRESPTTATDLTLQSDARDPGKAPLVGRQRELSVLRKALHDAERGAAVAHLQGPSGTGKSVLVEEFLEEAEAQQDPEILIVRSRCYELEQMPFKALDAVIDAIVRHLLHLNDLEVAQVLPHEIRALVQLFPVLDRLPVVKQLASTPTSIREAVNERQRGLLAYPEACQLIAHVCSSLSLLHSRGFVHRDVTPRNIRFTRQGIAKLIDFGAMVPVGPCTHGVGTPGFIAPEVMHHLQLDARTDVFSAGATLYYALTGRHPFAARTLAELSGAWLKGVEPLGPIGEGLPAALKELIASMLQLDPARRPSNAFEVRQRLAAISGNDVADSQEISQAYLSTPVLVEREAQQRQFRHYLRRTLQGDGLGLVVQGPSGTGRSRLLDAFVLESKTSGAIVLRVEGRGARSEALATMHRLAEQLLDALPDDAVTSAARASVFEQVFSPDGAGLPPLARWLERLSDVQTALPSWLKFTSQLRPIVIAVDDVERIDEASLAVLVSTVDAAAGSRLLVVTTTSDVVLQVPRALAVLAAHSTALSVTPLTAAGIEALFTSVFSGAHHVALVSDRVQKLSSGSPREALSLAQHLVGQGLIRFSEGHWILPSELTMRDLPASAEAALRAQVDALAELPRNLIEAQALALEGPWTLADYRALSSIAAEQPNSEALASLLRAGLIVERDATYTLRHASVRACVVTPLSAARRVEHERALAAMCEVTQRPRLVEVMHWLAVGADARALERLADVLRAQPTATQLYEQCSGVEGATLARVLERACEVSHTCQRPLREQFELRRLLIELSITTDNRIYYRHAPALLRQLELDSGLADYRAADAGKSSGERLQLALSTALARYSATADAQRVYAPDEAIRNLARYVPLSSAIGARATDTRLTASLHSLLEPFVGLSPLMHALWQSAIASAELTYKGRFDDARKRLIEIYGRLEQVVDSDRTYIDKVFYAITCGLAIVDVSLGHPSAEQWLSTMERDPLQRVNAKYLRRLLSIIDGDPESAERYRKQAEVLAVQGSTRQMFEAPLGLELYLQVQAGDLTGVKHAADRVAQLAAEWPGWIGPNDFAQASFHRLRGDLPAAKAAYERALAHEDPARIGDPPALRIWAAAAEGYVVVLDGLGRLEEAQAFGGRASETCERLELSGFYGVARALALVEARLGRYAEAVARLDGLMAKRAELRPSFRALDFEARARVAILAKDASAAAHFIQLATDPMAVHGVAQQFARRGRLLDEARRAGLQLDLPQSELESTLRSKSLQPTAAHVQAHRTRVMAAFGPLPDITARAQCALALLAEALAAASGHLYYADAARVTRVADLGATEPALDRFVAGFWRHRWEQAAITTVFTAQQLDGFALETGSWRSPQGTVYALVPLSPVGEAERVGLVALARARTPVPADFWQLAAAISVHLVELGDVTTRGRDDDADRV